MTGSKALTLVQMVSANYPDSRIDEKKTMALWLDVFRDASDDLMETAVRMCVLSCKKFPTVADIKQAIAEWYHEASLQTGAAALPHPRSRQTSPAADRAFTAIRSGQAKEYAENLYDKDVFEWIKCKMPDITDESIRRNYPEIQYAYESNVRCLGCRWHNGGCDTQGFYAVPLMMTGGFVKNEMARCSKKAGVK